MWEQGAQSEYRLYFAAPQSVQAECFAAVTLSVESACKAAALSAFLLGADGKVLGDSWFVFYGQTLSPDQIIIEITLL